jgi:hypothetical protein
MELKDVLKSQYRAALMTLKDVIEKCPDDLWYRPTDGSAPCWRVAYHTLYFTHFYLHQRHGDFVPWTRHQEEANYIAFVGRDNPRPPKQSEPYSQAELLEFWQQVFESIARHVDALDLTADVCGFPWYEMSTLEHQLVNLRHIQHHSAILSYRVRQGNGTGIKWVGKG